MYVCICYMHTHAQIHAVGGGAQGIGMRGVNRQGLSLWAMISSDSLRDPGVQGAPLPILGLGPVAILGCHVVSQLSWARGGARSRVNSAPSPKFTRKEQADRRV